MATDFPATGLDTFTDVETAGTILAATTNNMQDPIAAIEIKLGVNSSAVATSIDYLLKSASSTDPGHLHTTSGISGQIAVAQGGTASSTASAARTALGVAIGSDVQAYDADLAALAGLSSSDSNFIVGSASGWVAESGATARTSIGLGSVENTALSTWAGTTNVTTLGTIATGTWNGTAIANGNLANSSVNYGGVTLALGASDTTPAFNLSDATAYVGDSSLVTVGTVGTGTWQGTAVADTYVANDLTISGGTVNNSVIGGSTAAAGTFTQLDVEATGDLRLQDTTGGQYVGWDAPGTVSSSYMMTLPAAIGAVGEVLKINNTDGTLEWGAAGGGSAFTEAVTIAATDNSDPLLIITQSGSAGILQGIGADADSGFLFETDGGFQLNASTESNRNPTHDFGYANYAGDMNLYGLDNVNNRALRFSITLGQDNHSYMRLKGRNDNGASLFLGDDGGDATDYEYELGIQSGVAHDATTFSLSGADGIWNTSHAAGGAFNLTRPTTVAISSATTALTVTQSGAGGWIDFVGSMDNSSKDPTSDAPADWVEVQIAGSTYFLPAYAAS